MGLVSGIMCGYNLASYLLWVCCCFGLRHCQQSTRKEGRILKFSYSSILSSSTPPILYNIFTIPTTEYSIYYFPPKFVLFTSLPIPAFQPSAVLQLHPSRLPPSVLRIEYYNR